MITQSISVEALRARIDAGEQLHILDVRQPEERAEFALEPSLFIPLHELPERVGELEHLRNSELLVYCQSGNRSGQACMFLELSGFSNILNLSGGMLTWTKA